MGTGLLDIHLLFYGTGGYNWKDHIEYNIQMQTIEAGYCGVSNKYPSGRGRFTMQAARTVFCDKNSFSAYYSSDDQSFDITSRIRVSGKLMSLVVNI